MVDGPRNPFLGLLEDTELEDRLLRASREALEDAPQRSEYSEALVVLADFRIKARRLLEQERSAEERRLAGDIRDDPFFPEMQANLTPQQLAQLVGLQGAMRSSTMEATPDPRRPTA